MKIEEKTQKLRNVVTYVCRSFVEDGLTLNSVVLNKILWFSDVESQKKKNIQKKILLKELILIHGGTR